MSSFWSTFILIIGLLESIICELSSYEHRWWRNSCHNWFFSRKWTNGNPAELLPLTSSRAEANGCWRRTATMMTQSWRWSARSQLQLSPHQRTWCISRKTNAFSSHFNHQNNWHLCKKERRIVPARLYTYWETTSLAVGYLYFNPEND